MRRKKLKRELLMKTVEVCSDFLQLSPLQVLPLVAEEEEEEVWSWSVPVISIDPHFHHHPLEVETPC